MFNLQPPKTNYSTLDDIGKFNLLWKLSIIMIPIFLTLLVIHLIFNDSSWMTSLSCVTIAVINLILLKKMLKYKAAAIFTIVLGVILIELAIFMLDDSRLITEVLWSVLASFFAFLLLGVFSGSLVLMVTLAGIVIYLMNGSSHEILSKGISIEEVNYKMAVNVFYVGLAISFTMYQIVKMNRNLNNKYLEQCEYKEVLMKEIHHRVKNNLQIVSSLLKLQAAESENATVEEHFTEAISRIRSMALIHEKMYQNDDLAKLDIKAFLISLADDISNSTKSETNLEINVESELNKVDIKYVVSLSLIFNELMTNSIKHGFENMSDGCIDVEIVCEGTNVVFKYFDNGTWKEPKNSSTFGLELLDTLSEQLDGKCERFLKNGTHYKFTFDMVRSFKKER